MDLDYQEKYPKDNDYRQRFTIESSRFYTHKMLELVNGDETRMDEMKGAVPGLLLPNHLMYRIETLQSQDGHRLYEFLIEYDMKSPGEGIYYGSAVLLLPVIIMKQKLSNFGGIGILSNLKCVWY